MQDLRIDMDNDSVQKGKRGLHQRSKRLPKAGEPDQLLPKLRSDSHQAFEGNRTCLV